MWMSIWSLKFYWPKIPPQNFYLFNLQDWPSTRFVYHCIIVFFLPFRLPVMFQKYGKIIYQLISMKYLIQKDTENIEGAMPHTPICVMLKRNMCRQRKQGKTAAIEVILVHVSLQEQGFLSYISNDQSNWATKLAEYNFSQVTYHTIRSEHLNWDAWYLRVTGPRCVFI